MNKTSAVILALIAVTAAGLCIPAISKVNEASRRTQCVNNLKQIGVAIHAYHDFNRMFPKAIASVPTDQFTPEKQASWQWLISAYVESRMDPKFKMNIDKPWDDPENEYVLSFGHGIYMCPSSPHTHSESSFNFTTYVGITGVGKDAAWLPANDPKAGIFGYTRTVSTKDITDGASSTMMIAETGRDNGIWAKGGFTTARGIDRDEPKYLDEDGQFNSFHRSRFLSYVSVTNLLMADGSVKYLRNDASDALFEALATCAGGDKVHADDLDR